MIKNKTLDTIAVQVKGLDGAERSLSLGAKVNLQTVYTFPASPELLRSTLSGWFSWQKRNSITIEQALLSPNLAPQWIATLLALGARVDFFGIEEGELLLADYLLRTKAHRGKLAQVYLPLDLPCRKWGEAHVSSTQSDESIVTAIAVIDFASNEVKRARLALTGVWRESVRLAKSADLLLNLTLTEERIHQVMYAMESEVDPPEDFRASSRYRRAMAALMASRALRECMSEG